MRCLVSACLACSWSFVAFFCFDSEDTSLVFSTPDQTNQHLVQQTNWDKRMSSELSIISGLHYFLLNGINQHFLFWFVKGAMVLTMSFGDFHCLCLGKYDGYCSRGAKILALEPAALERIFSTSWTISYTYSVLSTQSTVCRQRVRQTSSVSIVVLQHVLANKCWVCTHTRWMSLHCAVKWELARCVTIVCPVYSKGVWGDDDDNGSVTHAGGHLACLNTRPKNKLTDWLRNVHESQTSREDAFCCLPTGGQEPTWLGRKDALEILFQVIPPSPGETCHWMVRVVVFVSYQWQSRVSKRAEFAPLKWYCNLW